MAAKDIVKVNRRTFFNPTSWFGYSTLKSQNQVIVDSTRDLFIAPKPVPVEEFDAVQKRYNVSEKQLQETHTHFQLLALLFLVLGIGAFLAGFYFLFVHSSFAALILGVAVAALFLGQAFRFNFWAFQIKHKKLGCTFEEWRAGVVKNDSDKPDQSNTQGPAT